MDLADFGRAEFEARWERCERLLAEAALDALFVTSEANYRYLAGHTTQFWLSKSRPMFALLVRGGAPILFTTANQLAQARRTSWIADIRTWAGFDHEGVELVSEALAELAARRGGRLRLGAELGEEQRLGLPYNEFAWLLAARPEVELLDAAPVIWGLRRIKSPAEIEYLRRSAQAAGRAYAEMFGQVRVGTTEREAYRDFMIGLFRHGAERPGYVPVSSGADNYVRRSGGPTDRALERGDLLWFDGGCTIRGYWSDTSRLAAIETASEAQRRDYRAVVGVTHRCLEEVRPGVPVAELNAFCQRALAEAGLPLHTVGRIGHGIGLDITEPPSLNQTDPSVLEAGMVITIEPAVVNEHGLFQIEEICAVTEDGHDLLTIRAPAELPIVGV